MKRLAIVVSLALSAFASTSGSAASGAQTKRCYLAVDGKVRVDGRCLVFPLGDKGYTLNTWDRGKPQRSHFAQVNAYSDGTGDASWNADPNDDHALDPLGTVHFVRGCWINRRVRICAR